MRRRYRAYRVGRRTERNAELLRDRVRRMARTYNRTARPNGWDGHEICDAPSSCAHAQWAMG